MNPISNHGAHAESGRYGAEYRPHQLCVLCGLRGYVYIGSGGNSPAVAREAGREYAFARAREPALPSTSARTFAALPWPAGSSPAQRTPPLWPMGRGRCDRELHPRPHSADPARSPRPPRARKQGEGTNPGAGPGSSGGLRHVGLLGQTERDHGDHAWTRRVLDAGHRAHSPGPARGRLRPAA